MSHIIKANTKDAALLSELAELTFRESHGHSAGAKDIDTYVKEKYTTGIFRNELGSEKNNYYFIYHNDQPAGYSNIIFNAPFPGSEYTNIAKLDRIYLLKEFYGVYLGTELFDFNIDLAKQHGQTAVWLYAWKENKRAVHFYTKKGFVIVGSYDFIISPSHSNPNHQMLLKF